ncbi:MAG: TSUP family transporter, partial [Pseudonocardiaceae bacterium]
MSIVAAVGLGLLIGAVLGALGGAGGILTVPALVYLLGQSAQDATTSSLVIVGLTALVGVATHARSGHVHWRTGIAFGIAGIITAVAGTALNRRVDEHVLLFGVSAVMIVAASGMLYRARRD